MCRIDPHFLGWQLDDGRTIDEPFWISLISGLQRRLAADSHVAHAIREHLFRGEESQATVLVAEVVPFHVVGKPFPRIADTGEASGVIGLLLAGLELAFAERVVVADPWAAVATGDFQFCHQVEVAVGRHGCAPVLVQGEFPQANAVTGAGFLHQLFGQVAVLLAGDL